MKVVSLIVYLQSVSREGRDHALAAKYVQSPYDENLDWKLSATMSPCHVKVYCVHFSIQFLQSKYVKRLLARYMPDKVCVLYLSDVKI